MTWGTIELEPGVEAWLIGLTDEEFGRAAFYIDLLEDLGVHLTSRTPGSCGQAS